MQVGHCIVAILEQLGVAQGLSVGKAIFSCSVYVVSDYSTIFSINNNLFNLK
jgi:hypothetical protein